MATAPLVRNSKTRLHDRGTWSSRDDRIASAVWLGVFLVGTIAGFGVDIRGFLHSNPPWPQVVYYHAAVFIVWVLLLTTQVLFVVGDRVAWHRSLGWFMVGWASAALERCHLHCRTAQ